MPNHQPVNCQSTSRLLFPLHLLTEFFEIQIGDYGLAKTLHPHDYIAADPSTTSNHSLASQTNADEECMKRFQPLRWLSPETLGLFLREPSALPLTQDSKESIWSLGVTIFEMCYLCQRQPFDQIADHQFLQAIHSDLTLQPINIEVGVKKESPPEKEREKKFLFFCREWKAKHFNR